MWLVIALEALVHRELEWPKNFSQDPPLIYNSSMILLSLSRRLKNYFLLKSDAWKVIFHLFAISSHSLFLLKSQDTLQGKRGIELKAFVSLLTALWRAQLQWLGHFQNLMENSSGGTRRNCKVQWGWMLHELDKDGIWGQKSF